MEKVETMSRFNSIALLSAVLFVLMPTDQAHGTWSIIAVDRETQEIGIAGASCTFDVSGIASVVPAKGAIVVQASSNYFARMKGVDLMEGDATVQEVLAAMRSEEFDPENQQYGVIVLAENTQPAVYSGNQITDWSGELVGDDVAVLGNILVGEEVVAKAFAAYNENRSKPFSQRLMLALRAGEQAGGDSRCGTQYARSAFMMIYDPDIEAIQKLSIQGVEKGSRPAVELLHDRFQSMQL